MNYTEISNKRMVFGANRTRYFLLIGMIVLVLAGGCSSGEDEPAATDAPTPTAVPTATPSAEPSPIAEIDTDAECPNLVRQAYENTQTACDATGLDQACYGNNTIQADPPDLPFNETGDIVDLTLLQGLRLSSMDTSAAEWGISLMRVQAAGGGGENVELVLFGNVEVEGMEFAEDGTLNSFIFQSGIEDRPCEAAPDSGIMIQTPQGVGEIVFLVNEVTIEMGSTVYLQAQPDADMVTSVVEGQANVTSQGRTVVVPAGSRTRIPLDAAGLAANVPSDPEPYADAPLQVLPVELLDEQVAIAPALSEEEIDAFAASASITSGSVLLESSFDSDTEEWTIFNDGTPIEHMVENGEGIVCSDDLSQGIDWYFLAPESWLGNWSEYYGGVLQFEIRQSSLSSQYDAPDVVIETSEGSLQFDTPNNPDVEFTRYEIPLTADAGWTLNGSPVEEADMSAALAVVTAFRIRGEFVAGGDSGCMNYVAVSASGAVEGEGSSISPPDSTQRGDSSDANSDGVSGLWTSTYGEITFGATSSTYATDNGRMFYEVSGNVLSGYWIEDSSAVGCGTERDGSAYWGRIEFVFNEDFTTFTGIWGYCEDEPTAAWDGSRLP